jgi:AcrR family transcriptional regulator
MSSQAEEVEVARREANRRGEGEQLRGDLIAAATDLLVSPQQISAPSLRAIARQVGVSPSGVYLHFASQDDLLAAVIEQQYEQLRVALAATDRPDAEPLDRLLAMACTYVDWGVEHPGAYQLLFESADVLPDGSQVIGTGDALLDDVAALVRAHGAARGASAAHTVALRLWIALHGLVSLRIHKPHASWSASARTDARALVRGQLGDASRPARPTAHTRSAR